MNISGKLRGRQVNRRCQVGLLYSRGQSLTNAEAKKRHCLRKCGTWWYDKYSDIYHPHPQPNGHEPYLKRERVIQPIKYAEHRLSTQDGPWWFFFFSTSKGSLQVRKTQKQNKPQLLCDNHSHSKTRYCWVGSGPIEPTEDSTYNAARREGPQAHPPNPDFPFLHIPRNALQSFLRASFQVGSDDRFPKRKLSLNTWAPASPHSPACRALPAELKMNCPAVNETDNIKLSFGETLIPNPAPPSPPRVFREAILKQSFQQFSLMPRFRFKPPSKVLSKSHPLKNHYKWPGYKWLYQLRDSQVKVKKNTEGIIIIRG